MDHAIPVYELAYQYHPARTDLVASRLASSMQVRAQEKALFEQVGRSEFLERTRLAVAFGESAIGIFFWIRKGRAAA